MKRILVSSLAGVVLLGLLGCGGGGGSSSGGGTPNVGTLTYVNPTNYPATFPGFALVEDPNSTSSNLILDLVGPHLRNQQGQVVPYPAAGLTFGFSADSTRVAWAGSNPNAITNGNIFTAGNSSQLIYGWVTGGSLQGILSAKGFNNMVTDIGDSGILAKVTLKPVPGAATGTVTLTDSGLGNLMDNNGPPALPIQIAVGTLTLK